jgi:hypothetical protein
MRRPAWRRGAFGPVRAARARVHAGSAAVLLLLPTVFAIHCHPSSENHRPCTPPTPGVARRRLQDVPAIHGNHRARDVARLFRTEEHHDIRHVLRITEPAERAPLARMIEHLG